MAYKSITSAVNLLRKFYANHPYSDTLTRGEMFEVLGKNPEDKKHKSMLASQRSLLMHHKLVKPVYVTVDGYRHLDSVTLTRQGRDALSRGSNKAPEAEGPEAQQWHEVPASAIAPVTGRLVTPQTVLEDVETLRKQNPGFEVQLVFHPKGEPMKQG